MEVLKEFAESKHGYYPFCYVRMEGNERSDGTKFQQEIVETTKERKNETGNTSFETGAFVEINNEINNENA